MSTVQSILNDFYTITMSLTFSLEKEKVSKKKLSLWVLLSL